MAFGDRVKRLRERTRRAKKQQQEGDQEGDQEDQAKQEEQHRDDDVATDETNNVGADSVDNPKEKNGKLDLLLDRFTDSCCRPPDLAAFPEDFPYPNNNMNHDDDDKGVVGADHDDAKANDGQDDDNNNDDDDLDAALANMDIDRDFGMSFSNVSDDDDDNVANKTVSTLPSLPEDPLHLYDAKHWQNRLSRDAIFSKLYRPSKEETKERETLAARLSEGMLFGFTDNVLSKLFAPSGGHQENHNPNILCKRGMVTLMNSTATGTDNGNNPNGPTGQNDRELILLTQGFVVARVPSTQLLQKLVNKTYDDCAFLTDVGWVKDLWQLPGHAFSVQIGRPKKEIRFQVGSAQEKEQWLDAWERVLLQTKERYDTEDEKEHRIVGWQHALVQRSLYTAAVTGAAFFGEQHLTKLDELDGYNEMGALHYAALHNNVHVLEHLVRVAGADKELKDGEGRTPMYYGAYVGPVHVLELTSLSHRPSHQLLSSSCLSLFVCCLLSTHSHTIPLWIHTYTHTHVDSPT